MRIPMNIIKRTVHSYKHPIPPPHDSSLLLILSVYTIYYLNKQIKDK